MKKPTNVKKRRERKKWERDTEEATNSVTSRVYSKSWMKALPNNRKNKANEKRTGTVWMVHTNNNQNKTYEKWSKRNGDMRNVEDDIEAVGDEKNTHTHIMMYGIMCLCALCGCVKGSCFSRIVRGLCNTWTSCTKLMKTWFSYAFRTLNFTCVCVTALRQVQPTTNFGHDSDDEAMNVADLLISSILFLYV